MPRPLIAVTDSVFPSLDPAIAALKRVDPELRVAKSAAADDILAVARDADAILVTYAKLPGDLLSVALKGKDQLFVGADDHASRSSLSAIDTTGSVFAPPWYIIGALAAGMLALTQLRESD